VNIRLTQIDGKLPNLALMKLAHWHKQRGDAVFYTRDALKGMFEPEYGAVYGSAIFKFSHEKLQRFKAQWPGAIVGGTGTDSASTVEQITGDYPYLDYSIYPEFKSSIGFTQRGCRLSCKFCVVPKKEGKPRHEATIAGIWRGAPWPKHLHLLDNDFFGGPDWRERIAEIRDGGFKVAFTQGINVRAMTPEVAAAIATIEYRDDSFSQRRLYTAWDNLKDEDVFFRGVDTLEAAGVPSKHLFAYMLIGFDKNETWDRILRRFDRMVERGIRPYPMPFDQSRRDLKAFQRWVVTGLYRAVRWEDYDVNAKRKNSSETEFMFSEAGK
jgi:hypothetical protein